MDQDGFGVPSLAAETAQIDQNMPETPTFQDIPQNIHTNTSAISAHMGDIDSTFAQPEDNDMNTAATLEDLKVQEQYEKLGKWLNGYGNDTTYDDIIEVLGLDEDYTTYTSSINSLFGDIASSAPSLYHGYIRQNAQAAPEGANERLLADWFRRAFNRMKRTDFNGLSVAKPARSYAYKDHQDTYVPGTRINPTA